MKQPSVVRERIVATASRLFYEQGYNLTGINQVIAEADIARGSLYQHFDSKEELLLECMRRFHEAWFQDLESFSQACETPKDKVLGLFDYRLRHQQESKFGGCRFLKINAEVSRENHRVFELVAQHKVRLHRYVRDLVCQAMPHAEATGVENTVDTVFLLLEGAGISSTVQQDAWALTRARDLTAALL